MKFNLFRFKFAILEVSATIQMLQNRYQVTFCNVLMQYLNINTLLVSLLVLFLGAKAPLGLALVTVTIRETKKLQNSVIGNYARVT